MTDTHLVFLPWTRQGAAATIATIDPLNASARGAAELTANLEVNGESVPVPVRLRGPADVLGIDPLEIVRTDPRPGTADFEPNYFAAIEFDRPDFPWLFTPLAADANQRLRPWLCLIVVRKQDGVAIRNAVDAPLPALEIAAPAKPLDELPDLTEIWAWVHTQVSGVPADVTNALTGAADRSLSRLIAPRILQPNTEYIACVVPTFDLGRKAGLGLEITENDITSANALKPAWAISPAPKTVTLPIYHHWRFRTGENMDFESLVRLLQARAVPEGLGLRTMSIATPGFPVPIPQETVATLDLEGALQPMKSTDLVPWPAGVEAPFKDRLANIVNVPGETEDSVPDADPVLGPPLYGRWHAARKKVTASETPWFDELNLDPRHRSVAAFGTRVIQEHQEALMASAWDQSGELERANQRLRQLQLSMVVGMSVYTRNFQRMSHETMVRVAAPSFARLRGTLNGAPDQFTIAGRLAMASVPVKQATSVAMRRIARERGPVTRRAAAVGFMRATTDSWVRVLGNLQAAEFVNVPPATDVATFSAVNARLNPPNSLVFYPDANATKLGLIVGRRTFRVVPEGQPVVAPPNENVPPSQDNPTARNFRAAAQVHLTAIRPDRVSISLAQVQPRALQAIREDAQVQLDPRHTFVALAQAVITAGANATPPTTTTKPIPIEPIMMAPKFPWPMYEPLRDLSAQLLLPGIDKVAPNTVLGLQTNRRFVDAYMVGLNFEMGRELLWRGFPTDQRGTCFERFWDTRGASGASLDAQDIHMWGTRSLGAPPASNAEGERFVMLMRSELLRRYPGAVIYAVKAKLENDRRVMSTDADDERYPIFRGSMDPDVTFFGFDLSADEVLGIPPPDAFVPASYQGYFIVIQEQPGEPRFGFDIDTPVGSGAYLKVSDGVPAGTPMKPGHMWGHNGAHMAAILRQLPVRIAIHASQFMPRS